MILKKRAEFLVVNKDNSSNKIVADNAEQAAAAFETESNPVCQVSRDHEVNQYVVDPDYTITASVGTEAAETAGCTVYPTGEWTKKPGDKIILTAVAATGYTFTSWTLASTVVSSTAEFEATIPTLTSGTSLEYVANFSVG